MTDFTMRDLVPIIGEHAATNLVVTLQKQMVPKYKTLIIKDSKGIDKRQAYVLFNVDKTIEVYKKRLKRFNVLEKHRKQWHEVIVIMEKLKETA